MQQEKLCYQLYPTLERVIAMGSATDVCVFVTPLASNGHNEEWHLLEIICVMLRFYHTSLLIALM